jgi:C-terminal processing protease CtpA/Prc
MSPDGLALTERLFSPAELKSDLAFLADAIQAVHPRPGVIPLVGSAEKRSALERSLREPMRRFDVCLRAAPLVNDSPDGHTFLNLPSEEFRRWEERGGRLLPWDVEFRSRHGDAAAARGYVAASHAPETDVSVGDEVLAVDGVPTAQLAARLLPFVNGETPVRRLVVLRYALPGLLRAVCGFGGPFEVTVRADDQARPRTATHPGVAAADRPAPWEGQTPFRYWSWRDDGIGIIDFRDFVDPERFEAFLEQTFAQIRREGVRALVVDLRNNTGGNSVLGEMLLGYVADRPVAQLARREVKVSQQIKELYRGPQRDRARFDPDYDRILAAPEGSLLNLPARPATPQPVDQRFRGDLYVLIGPATYSSAIMLASAVKDHRLGVLVGEETAGTATLYGDACPFTLPHTGLQGFVSHKWFLRPSGVDDGRGVLPDVETPAEAALDRARELIAGGAR